MRIRENLPVVLAGVALCLAAAQEIHPFGLRIQPVFLVVIALLLLLRQALRRQSRKRVDILRSVPPNPLGLSEDPPGRHEE